MSAIAGIYNFNEGQSVHQEGFLMMDYFKRFPVDSIDIYSKDNLFFGCHAQWIMPEDLNKKKTFYDSEKRLAITSDAILDNRDELFNKLNVDQSDRKVMTDNEIILLAYCKWKEEMPKHLNGEFAFMIWDEKEESLFGARDFSGKRTFYYYHDDQRVAFATLLNPLLELPYISNELNKYWLAEFLTIQHMNDVENPNITVYKNILSVPPSHTITVKNGKLSLLRYLNILDNKELKLKNNNEYIAAFRDVFQTAVNSRLRTIKKIGSELSGGLDSGSVVSFASNSLKDMNKTLTTFSAIPIPEFQGWNNKYRLPDESEYIKSTVNHVGNISDHYEAFNGCDPYSDIDEWLDIMEMPFKFFENSVWLKGIYKQAQSEGIGILLNGQRGNYTISWGPELQYFANLMKTMKWIKLNSELKLYSKNINVNKSQVVRKIRKIAFPKYFKSHEEPYIFPEMISNELAEKTNIYESLKDRGLYQVDFSKIEIHDLRKHHFVILNNWNITGTTGTKLSLNHSIRPHDPTNDLRVVQFCLSVPIDQFIRNGYGRWMIRRATEGYLPDKVRLNQRIRGIQGVDVIQRMSAQWSAFLDEFDYICTDPLTEQYLNLDTLKTARNNLVTDDAFNPSFRVMMRSIIVYRFLKRLKGGDRYEKRLAATSIGST
ncbi:asparagine synthase-related protein [Fictibacillus barbaricus]|uniref:asparagine synthase (glutamine-hydrolyzing) n=1 Tax=Fictibacillus barbaricus TaxID=182136 RepID=A0ABU1U1N8_9BACL|nr:asparagine synthase-related protein [Fictibacillus barbaricus]MDR7073384.1 asparagine synthase (glutamine-hydrolyzing) [Fictibacillus barbaricus]